MDAYIDVVGAELREVVKSRALTKELRGKAQEGDVELQSLKMMDPADAEDEEYTVPIDVHVFTRFQASIICFLRPGQWLFLRNIRRAHVVWRTSTSAGEALRLLKRAADVLPHYQCTRAIASPFHFQARFYTPGAGWVDAVDVTASSEDSDSQCVLDAWSKSCSVAPAALPGAPLLGIAFCWLPFSDHGQNFLHLQELRQAMIQESGGKVECSEDIDIAGDCKDTSKPPKPHEELKAEALRGPEFNIAALCAYVCGVALGMTWISMTCSIWTFCIWWGTDISYQMQFSYNIPILLIVIIQKKIDPLMIRVMGAQAWYAGNAAVAFIGNFMFIFYWDWWHFVYPFDVLKLRINLMSGGIGIFSAIGYGAFMLLVGVLDDTCNYAFRYGFMTSGVWLFCIMCVTTYEMPWSVGWAAELRYWHAAAYVVLAGLLAAIVLITRRKIIVGLKKRQQQVMSEKQRDSERVSNGYLLGKVWPCTVSVFFSFMAGMLVFVHFPHVPSQQPRMPMVLTFINMFFDVIGQKIADLCLDGSLPTFVRTPKGVLFTTCIRLGFLPWYFIYIFNAKAWGIVNDIGISIYVAVFVLMSGFCSASAYSIAANQVELRHRRKMASSLSAVVFAGLYPAFLIAYLMATYVFTPADLLPCPAGAAATNVTTSAYGTPAPTPFVYNYPP